MSRVVHFEIQADDVERAKAFYAAVFDWSFKDYGQTAGATYWGVVTGALASISLAACCRGPRGSRAGAGHQRPTSAPWASATTTRRSVASLRPGRWRCPRWRSPAWPGRATTSRTEGSTFGLHQPDPEAR